MTSMSSSKQNNKSSIPQRNINLFQRIIVVLGIFLIFLIIWNNRMTEQVIPDESNIKLDSNHAVNFKWTVDVISSDIKKYRVSSKSTVDDLNESINQYMTYGHVMSLLSDRNYYFMNSFFNHFYDFPSKSYFFECIPVTKSNFHNQEFEFVLISAPQLDNIDTDVESFAEYFTSCNEIPVIAFPNLGRNAILIIPCPKKNESQFYNFAQLSRYMRSQSFEQSSCLWKKVADTVVDSINELGREDHKKLWLSTSGLGVYWLHIRLDDYPKYYNYEPYKN